MDATSDSRYKLIFIIFGCSEEHSENTHPIVYHPSTFPCNFSNNCFDYAVVPFDRNPYCLICRQIDSCQIHPSSQCFDHDFQIAADHRRIPCPDCPFENQIRRSAVAYPCSCLLPSSSLHLCRACLFPKLPCRYSPDDNHFDRETHCGYYL